MPTEEEPSPGPDAELLGIIGELKQPSDVFGMARRVQLCRRALELVPRSGNAKLWAALQGELGNSLLETVEGSRAENLEEAIACYRDALEVMTRQALPVQWATARMNLGNAYLQRIRGERAENLEEAIACYRDALEVMTRQAMPVDWAQTTTNLGNAYSERVRGERAENLEEAIACYRDALEVMTRQALPVQWATTRMNLGNAYLQRIRGERAENLEQAIACYRDALEVMTRQALPVDWATARMNLGNAYLQRIRGDRAENLEEAIACYRHALEVRTRQAMPVEWARTTTNLGTAYSDRIRGERAENLEEAIACYRDALEVMTRQALPVDWAQTTTNLGTAYAQRIRGERAENLEQAIACYRDALEVMTRQALPVDWATTRMNLGNAYLQRIRGERAENLEEAISCYRDALEVMTRQAMPVDWATTQMNLGNAYRNRIRGERAENLEEAIARYRDALEVRTRQAMPVQWAATRGNLGNAYVSLEAAKRSGGPLRPVESVGERAENLEEAIACYRDALEVMTREALLEDHVRAQGNLARACLDLGRWGEAAQSLQSALDTCDTQLEIALTPDGRSGVLREVAGLPSDLAFALAKDNRPLEAAQALEHNRARWLQESLALGSFADRLPEADRAAFKQAVERYQSLQAEARLPEMPGRTYLDVARDLRKAYEALGKWKEQTTDADLADLSSATPLVYAAATSRGGVALVVRRNAAVAVWLPELTNDAVRERAQNLRNQPKAALDEATQWLWNAAMGSVVDGLQGAPEAVLIPCGLLSMLPLHAAWTDDKTKPTGRRYALDEVAFRYAPRASAIVSAATAASKVLVIDEPKPVSASPLPNSAREAAAVRGSFRPEDGDTLAGEQAAVNAILQSLKGFDVWHLSCHGGADLGDPLKSGLLMANNQLLALQHVLELKVSGVRLAVLSACETAIPGVRLPDEILGLPAGFLHAGVQGVIASLWPVHDASTMMLMTRFYDDWRRDHHEIQAPHLALRAAQQWLRDTTNQEKVDYFKQILHDPNSNAMTKEAAFGGYATVAFRTPGERSFADPYHWAAFGYTGA